MNTQDLTENWTVGWNYLWQQAQSLYTEQVRANPKAYEAQVRSFVQDLTTARTNLDRIKAGLAPGGNRPEDAARFSRLARQHYELATRFYADTRPTDKTELGFMPVLIVLGLAIGISATAWAAGAWQYATNLREQTALAARELEARVAASRDGRVLQPSTLPLPPEPALTSTTGGAGKWLLGGLLMAAGVAYLPTLLRNRS